ncbi:MAG: hypothetical protein OEN22_01300 [Gammaproteobacteria bacterium]|nr:hypothetical protein [Gammaproteobacteria bacterium]
MIEIVRSAILLTTVSLVASACATSKFSRTVGVAETESRTIDWQLDPINRTVRERDLKTALVVTVTFSETDRVISFSEPQVLTVHARSESTFESVDTLNVIASNSADEEVGSAFVPRRRYKVSEELGLVESLEESVVVTIPLDGRPEVISAKGDSFEFAVQPLNVEGLINSFCDEHLGNSLCTDSPIQ